MSLFISDPARRIRQYFTEVTPAGERFLKGNTPTETTFKHLFNSVPFILDRSDAAKEYNNDTTKQNTEGIQGLVVLARPVDVKARTEPDDKELGTFKRYSYAVRPIQLPEVQGLPLTDDSDTPNYNPGQMPANDRNIVVLEDNTTNVNHTIWKPQLSQRFLNFLWSNLKGLSDALSSAISRITTLEDTVVTKTGWITMSPTDGVNATHLIIYTDDTDVSNTEAFITNYDNTGGGGGKVYARYKILDNICYFYYSITLKAVDFANNGELYRFRFKILNKNTSSITAKAVGSCFARDYTTPTATVFPTGCMANAVNNGNDVDINIYHQSNQNLSPTEDVILEGQIFFEINPVSP